MVDKVEQWKGRLILRKKEFLCFILLFIAFGSTSISIQQVFGQDKRSYETSTSINYKENMIALIEQISTYAKTKNTGFTLIQNNGLDLFKSDDVTAIYSQRLAESVDGVLIEGLYYGGGSSHDYQKTKDNIRHKWERTLKIPQKYGLTILNVDYCGSNSDIISKSVQMHKQNKIIGFPASSYELDSIPRRWQIPGENDKDIVTLNQAENFLILLNPGRFVNKQHYLKRLQDSNYDLLIIDYSYNAQPLSAEDVASLKTKKNGAARLVIAYLSVGEAEDYRSYWQKTWANQPPDWLTELNPDWQGNYKVKYWSKEWQNILYGSSSSYLDVILAAGFDGIFMDVIDAYDYFENI